MTHVTCRLTAENRDQLRIRSVIEYGLPLPFFPVAADRAPAVSIDICGTRPCSAANQPHAATALDRRDRQTDERTDTHICFLLFSFSLFHFLVVGSVRYIKLTRVGFRAHVKIASRIVSYRYILRRVPCVRQRKAQNVRK